MRTAESVLEREAALTSDQTFDALMECWQDYRPDTTETQLGIIPTSLVRVSMPGRHKLFVQNESVQPGRNFKYNGMAFGLQQKLAEDPNIQRLYIGSAGNAGAALVAAAFSQGREVVVETPSTLVESKRTLIEGPHSVVHAVHANVEEALDAARTSANNDPYGVFMHAYDDLDAIAGQGLVAKRAFRSLLQYDAAGAIDLDRERIAVLVQRGGGSLLTGFACELYNLKQQGVMGDNVQLYEVRPSESSSLYDGLHVRAPGRYAQTVLDDPEYVAGTVYIDDVDAGRAADDMARHFHSRFEPSGVAGAAAFKHLQSMTLPTTFITVLTGANYNQAAYDYFTNAPRRAQKKLLNNLGSTSMDDLLDRPADPLARRGLNPCDYGRYPRK